MIRKLKLIIRVFAAIRLYRNESVKTQAKLIDFINKVMSDICFVFDIEYEQSKPLGLKSVK